MFRILVVEDDNGIRMLMEDALADAGYEPVLACNGLEALEVLEAKHIDLIILDIMMPKMDGYELLRQIRAASRIPVIVLTAKNSLDDKVELLGGGADDYLTKPFSVEELLARLRVTFRRLNYMAAAGADNHSVFENGDLKIDYASCCVFLNGTQLHLTPIEYKLLCLLARNVGKVLTHSYITKEVWGSSWDNDVASLRVFMATLRKKIEKDPSDPQYIQTHVGIGYRMLRVETDD